MSEVKERNEKILESLSLDNDTNINTDTENKSLDNTNIDVTKENVSDIKVIGNADAFQLICETFSKKERWMESTKAMQLPNGCLVQVTTQQGNNVAKAVTFVPGVSVVPIDHSDLNKGHKFVEMP